MKKYILLMIVVSLGFSKLTWAQDEVAVTDAEIYRYAMLMQVVDLMKKDISAEVNEMIKNQEGIDGARYKELSAAVGDEAKLSEIEAKDFEIKFINLVEEVKNERIEAIKEVNKILATKMVGDRGKVYKKVKAAIKDDPSVKEKYKAIREEIGMDEAVEDLEEEE